MCSTIKMQITQIFLPISYTVVVTVASHEAMQQRKLLDHTL